MNPVEWKLWVWKFLMGLIWLRKNCLKFVNSHLKKKKNLINFHFLHLKLVIISIEDRYLSCWGYKRVLKNETVFRRTDGLHGAWTTFTFSFTCGCWYAYYTFFLYIHLLDDRWLPSALTPISSLEIRLCDVWVYQLSSNGLWMFIQIKMRILSPGWIPDIW